MYSKYDMEVITYLSLEIEDILKIKDKSLLIDLYFENMLKIYEDYKEYDNPNKSLLDSVNEYIHDNENKIKDMIKYCIE